VIRTRKPENIETGQYFNGESLFLAFCRTVATDIFGRLRYSSFRRESTRWRLIEYTFREIFAGRIKQDIHHKILAATERAMYRTRFARLSIGHIALVPEASEKGDNIWVLTGSSTPMGLRKEFPTASPVNSFSDASAIYRMIGPCYVHGVMDGEMTANILQPFPVLGTGVLR
jgi:hypothetical protein